MFDNLFFSLKQAAVPVTLREYLVLLEGMEQGLAMWDVEEFYFLSRTALVKDERFLDRFDQVFGHVFKGLEVVSGPDAIEARSLPEEWLRKLAEKHLSEEEKKEIEAAGGFEELMKRLAASRMTMISSMPISKTSITTNARKSAVRN